MIDPTAGSGADSPVPARGRVVDLIGQVGGVGNADDVLRELDSLALVELVVSIETDFGLEIPDEVLTDEMFASVDDLTAAIERLLQPT